MKIETLARRIAQKAGAPELEEAILQHEVPDTIECMLWTGKKTRQGLFPRMVRDAEGRPSMEPHLHRPAPVMQFDRQTHYVNRLVFSLIYETDLTGRKLQNLCGETLCVNPLHWRLKVVETAQVAQSEIEIDEPEDWTIEEAVEILEMYLTTNETLDREHPLLIDVPTELLDEALTILNKEHML